jgi:WD40 repeat protein
MTAAREGHTATLLADGRVLIAGGVGSYGRPVDKAEIYDPNTRAFSVTASIDQASGMHTATLLRDGRVLVIGEYGRPAVFDPTTGLIDFAGSMASTRRGHAAVALRDGRVLVLGGNDDTNLATAELFDPTTGTFTPTGPMNTPRAYTVTATLLQNGRVLVLGGGSRPPSAEEYDPVSGKFTPVGSMTIPQDFPKDAVLLPDGRALVASEMGTSAELYDPATRTFSATGSVTTDRRYSCVAPLPDGRVLFAGGYTPRSSSFGLSTRWEDLASAEIYDPKAGQFASTASMEHPRSHCTAVLLRDGHVLISGGTDTNKVLASTELFGLK